MESGLVSSGIAAAIADAAAQASQSLLPVAGRVLHVDGDYLAYYAAGGDDMPAGVARQVAVDRIMKMTAACQATHAVVHLTDDSSHKGHRYALATVKPYQGNRSGKSKPRNWATVRDMLMTCSSFDRRVWVDREADDGLAGAAYTAVANDTECVIASTDKDMRMLPGWHLDWKTGGLTEVPPYAYDVIGENGLQYGLKWLCLQMLQGDTADNIPGLPRYINSKGVAALCGEKTAQKLLDQFDNFDDAINYVRSLYQDYYWFLKEDPCAHFVEQLSLLWLRPDKAGLPQSVLHILPAALREEVAVCFATTIKSRLEANGAR